MSYTSQHQGTVIDKAVSEHNELRQIILDTIYPVGSLYTSFNSTNPASIMGGTWTQIKDCFLMAAGSSYAIGTSGGAATHTHTSAAHTHTTAAVALTIAQMPSHSHAVTSRMYSDGTDNGSAFGISNYWGDPSGNNNYIIQAQSVTSKISNGYSVGAVKTGGGASHSHGNTGSTTPGATGSSSHLPPYKTIYMWQRTA